MSLEGKYFCVANRRDSEDFILVPVSDCFLITEDITWANLDLHFFYMGYDPAILAALNTLWQGSVRDENVELMRANPSKIALHELDEYRRSQENLVAPPKR